MDRLLRLTILNFISLSFWSYFAVRYFPSISFSDGWLNVIDINDRNNVYVVGAIVLGLINITKILTYRKYISKL